MIDGALKAARATSKAANRAEEQTEALATSASYVPTDKDLSNVPDVSVREMTAVLAVARLGSFTNAAIEQGVSQPGLSRQVQRIEKDYGFDVFDRGKRGAPATPQGALVLESFRTALNALARSVEAARKLISSNPSHPHRSSPPTLCHHMQLGRALRGCEQFQEMGWVMMRSVSRKLKYRGLAHRLISQQCRTGMPETYVLQLPPSNESS